MSMSLLRSAAIATMFCGVTLSALSQAATPQKNRASMETMQIPSHGSLMNGLMYVAEGAGPHPVVILLHGFPGNEQNLDLAQDMRRAGWDVLFFHYRGAWGSSGDYSFTHVVEDVASAVAYVRDPANAQKLRADSKHIVLLGHSAGGFAAVQVGAADPTITAIGLISAADMAGRIPENLPKQAEPVARARISKGLAAEGMAPLSGTSPDALAQETLDHATQWRFLANAKALSTRPLLNVTSDDGLAGMDDALAEAVRKDGDAAVTSVHFATDHAYSDKRQELSAAVLQWLKGLPLK
ncbi:alpha/beta hydrolase [Terriglobus roseus]|uniref:Serine aminopeptidase, S33 n=1 Tax=Terriglobus roseus TaxID=392734 RepID=A0A1G7G8K6_9BACT|nr:alpha/beta hydrolase [Terriglobus roseus]SDE84427.1 Serine aminopeptidase, S33 [Terriglobus roseus]